MNGMIKKHHIIEPELQMVFADVLGGSIGVFDIGMYITAIKVRKGENGVLEPVDKTWQGEMDALEKLSPGGGPLATATIPGRPGEWIIYFTPFSK